MKLIITAKTGKKEKSTEKEINETVRFCMDFIEEHPNLDLVGCRCMCDGTSAIFKKTKFKRKLKKTKNKKI